MPRKTTPPSMTSSSVRYGPEAAEWLKQRSTVHNGSLAEAIRQCIEDARTWFDIPSEMRERLQEQMKQLGKRDHRDYMRMLLLERYTDLVTEESKKHR
jgi:hypothetical protein